MTRARDSCAATLPRLLGALALVALATLVPGCGRDAGVAEQPAAAEAEELVAPAELERYLALHLGPDARDLDPAARRRFVEELRAEVLFAREAERLALPLDPALVDAEAARLAELLPEAEPAAREADARRSLLAEVYEAEVLLPALEIDEEEVEAALAQAGRQRTHHVVFRQIVTEEREAAEAARRRVERQGETFETVALEVSLAPESGALVERDFGELPAAASEALRRLREGDTSRPVKINELYYLFHLVTRNRDPDPGRSREREQVRERLLRDKLDALRAERLAELAAPAGREEPAADDAGKESP